MVIKIKVLTGDNENHKIIILFKGYCGVKSPINRIYPLWGASPSRFIGSNQQVEPRARPLKPPCSPTSVRVPSHIWFISLWSSHMCTTTTYYKNLVVHYSLCFTAYKEASGGFYLRCGTPRTLREACRGGRGRCKHA